MSSWLIYTGVDEPHDGITRLPEPPNWRTFGGRAALSVPPDNSTEHRRRLGRIASPPDPDDKTVRMINAALYLRRPLLITGRPGTGKSSLAYAVARELRLGPVLRWPITSRSTLQEGLYRYDPIARLGDENLRQIAARQPDAELPADSGIGRYLRLGPLGTALLPYSTPRVLLIDEIDKCDIDLPNDLLNVFEDGEYEIPELSRLPTDDPVIVRTADRGVEATIENGLVTCQAFPFVVLTSNGEREFPPAFLRRCLRLNLPEPSEERIAAIVAAHLGPEMAARATDLINDFVERRRTGQVATDQLLNAVYLAFSAGQTDDPALTGALLENLSAIEAP
ncbi:AAA family ATPase [Plantactinospora solaniradicis]|uniref:AAA family ATPase n=1 Tax=Plantactinospora solaniradicis TaxID=1723736 RepID=A0ABW1K739_9ACTN